MSKHVNWSEVDGRNSALSMNFWFFNNCLIDNDEFLWFFCNFCFALDGSCGSAGMSMHTRSRAKNNASSSVAVAKTRFQYLQAIADDPCKVCGVRCEVKTPGLEIDD